MVKTCKILLHPNNEQKKILVQRMGTQSLVDKYIDEDAKIVVAN
jgi:hypothetical protein